MILLCVTITIIIIVIVTNDVCLPVIRYNMI